MELDTIRKLAATPPPAAFDATKIAPANPAAPRLRYAFSHGAARLAHLEAKFELPETRANDLLSVNAKLDILDEIDRQVSGEAPTATAPAQAKHFQVFTPFEATRAAITPATNSPTAHMKQDSATPFTDQYKAIRDPKEKVAFYRLHEACMNEEFAANRPKPAPPAPSPFAAEDAKNLATYRAITHAGDKVQFYRDHARSLDRAIETPSQ